MTATRCWRPSCSPAGRATISSCRRRARSWRARSRPGPIGRSTRRNCRIGGNLDPRILALVATADPGNAHGVPYLWSVTGIGYEREPSSRAALGRSSAARQLGADFRSGDRGEARTAAGSSCSTRRRKSFRRRSPGSGSILRAVELGDLDRALGGPRKDPPLYPPVPLLAIHQRPRHWGSVRRSRLFGRCRYRRATGRARPATRSRSRFRVPREGAQMSIDMLGIPADAPHPDNALRFIDYILRPDVIADDHQRGRPIRTRIWRRRRWSTRRSAAIPAIYPPDEVRRRFYIDRAGAARLRAGAHPRLEPAQIGLLSGQMALLEIARRQQAFRRRRGGRRCLAQRREQASFSRCWGRRDAARRRCCE